MDLLVSQSSQESILATLRTLIEKEGPERFLSATIVLPSPRHFPEGWGADLYSANDLTKRLLGYARMEHYAFKLIEFVNIGRDSEFEEDAIPIGNYGGIKEGELQFGVNSRTLFDPDVVAATMAHEVAHAYRAANALEQEDCAVEERCTDISTAYLGFGVLIANSAYHTRVERSPNGGSVGRSRAGYLELEEITFILAIQAIARDLDQASVLRIERHLESSQQSCFRAAYKQLRKERKQLLIHLGIVKMSPTTDWSLRTISETTESASYVGFRVPWGRFCYRLEARYWTLGAISGFVLMVLVLGVLPRNTPQFTPLICTLPMAGSLLGALFRRYCCTNPECLSPVSKFVSECPTCYSTFIGELYYASRILGSGSHRGKPVYRIAVPFSLSIFAINVTTGLCVGAGLVAFGFGTSSIFYSVLTGATAAWIRLRLKPQDVCTGRQCGEKLEPLLRQCPACLGTIRGRVERPQDAL